MTQTVTETRNVYDIELTLLGTREYLETLRSLLDREGIELLERTFLEEDEKCLLAAVLLHIVYPRMEKDERFVEFEEGIRLRINDPDYIARMEALEEERRITQAVVEGMCEGINATRRAMVEKAQKLLSEMTVESHEARTNKIDEIRGRIETLSTEEIELIDRVERVTRKGEELLKKSRKIDRDLERVLWKV